VLGAFLAPALVSTSEPSAWRLFPYLFVVQAACVAVARYRGWWSFALATLAGATLWPFVWIASGAWGFADELPVGLYLLATSIVFYLGRSGWRASSETARWRDLVFRADRPARTIWIAASVISALFVIAVDAADYSTGSLFLFGVLIVLYGFAARRDAVFDGLPAVAAVAMLAIMSRMELPATVRFYEALPGAPLVPPELWPFTAAALAFGALFAIGGFALMWDAKRPAVWAGVSAAPPVLLLVLAYWRITAFAVDFAWSASAIMLAAVALFAVERIARYRESRDLSVALGFYAAAVIALLSLAATMSLRQAWLTVALSLQLPVLAWAARKLPGRSLQILAGIVAAGVLIRLVFNYHILDYGIAGAVSWVIYGYGIPALAFYAAAHVFRKNAAPLLVTLLEAGALAFFVLLVSLQIRLFVSGSLSAPYYRLPEQSLQSIAWLAIGTTLAVRAMESGSKVAYYGARILLGLAAAQIVFLQLLFSNPITTQDYVGSYPVVNILFLAYAIPAGFALLFASYAQRISDPRPALIAAVAGLVLLFVYVTLEVRRAFQGPVLFWTAQSDAEFYSYSVAWLIYALALLGFGIGFGQRFFRYASIAVLAVTVSKVFLLDMDGLTGLFRVASFLGLGLSLVGIGYLYQRFVFRRPDAPPDAIAPR
jgi:uncharacterized membrane protein